MLLRNFHITYLVNAFLPIFGTFDVYHFTMSKNTSISLGDYFDDFVKDRINVGRFKNVSEVVRAGLRLLEEEEARVTALRNAIEEGINSGQANDFDPEKHLSALKEKKRANG